METGMTVVGGLGYTNCSYGYGVGNMAGYGTAGYDGVFVLTSEKPAVVTAPGQGGAPVLGLALEVVAEPEPTKLEKLAALATMGVF